MANRAKNFKRRHALNRSCTFLPAIPASPSTLLVKGKQRYLQMLSRHSPQVRQLLYPVLEPSPLACRALAWSTGPEDTIRFRNPHSNRPTRLLKLFKGLWFSLDQTFTSITDLVRGALAPMLQSCGLVTFADKALHTPY
jgi:hypothetical protein